MKACLVSGGGWGSFPEGGRHLWCWFCVPMPSCFAVVVYLVKPMPQASISIRFECAFGPTTFGRTTASQLTAFSRLELRSCTCPSRRVASNFF